ncbi:oplophorus-luciferin 2-monooxygenase non-catalytic subunit-like [Panulirus ornatus]|uniref:oplophorus-luciferin 2-monooxygenase non-catalytic subunit-like n=1 Tax=Panulirus ornatus TaxID=150431 RepID=UPI003A86965F
MVADASKPSPKSHNNANEIQNQIIFTCVEAFRHLRFLLVAGEPRASKSRDLGQQGPPIPWCRRAWEKPALPTPALIPVPSDKPCPSDASIHPCTCVADDQLNVDVDCSAVTGEDELREIFQNNFPSTHCRRLTIYENQNLGTLREGDLGTATFQEIWITEGALTTVQPNALSESFSTAKYLVFNYNSISEFPFSQLSSFTNLLSLDLRHNNLKGFPGLNSTTLQSLYFTKNPLGHLPVDAFVNTPALSDIQLSQTGIHDLESGTFSGLPNLRNVALGGNHLTSLRENSVEFDNRKGLVDVGCNDIHTVAANAFPGLIKGWVYIHHNHLTELAESAWWTLLNNGGYVDAFDNPLQCGCDVAWLVRNSTLLHEVDIYTTCANGVPLRSLDPADYRDC